MDLYRVYVRWGFFGFSIGPGELTARIGMVPDGAGQRGDRQAGRFVPVVQNMWFIQSRCPAVNDLADHVDNLLQRLSPNRKEVLALSEEIGFPSLIADVYLFWLNLPSEADDDAWGPSDIAIPSHVDLDQIKAVPLDPKAVAEWSEKSRWYAPVAHIDHRRMRALNELNTDLNINMLRMDYEDIGDWPHGDSGEQHSDRE